jgi:3',5'-cyclic AMP phosphodiesterase CpdA
MRVLHASDIHLTQDYRALPLWRMGPRFWMAAYELFWQGRAQAYQRAGDRVREIVSAMGHWRAEHLVISGDLTSSATEEEFRMARAALQPLADSPEKLTVIPGNHDCHHPAALREKRFERHFGQLLHSDLPEHRRDGSYPFVRLIGDEAAVVGVHSSLLPSVPGVSYGRLGPAQLDGVAAIVSDKRLEDRALLVAVHHAPRTQKNVPDKLSHRLLDAEKLLALLPGPRFAVLHGHIHRRFHHPATSLMPHLFGAGSSTQSGREGAWLIEVDKGEVRGGTSLVLSADSTFTSERQKPSGA